MQLVRERVNVLAEAYQPRANRPHRLRLRFAPRDNLGATDFDRQHGQPLRHVVVQLPRKQRALRLVGLDQALAQVTQRVGSSLRLGDVAEDAVRLDRASGGIAPGDLGQVVNPSLASGRMQKAIFDGNVVPLAGVQFLALEQHR